MVVLAVMVCGGVECDGDSVCWCTVVIAVIVHSGVVCGDGDSVTIPRSWRRR